MQRNHQLGRIATTAATWSLRRGLLQALFCTALLAAGLSSGACQRSQSEGSPASGGAAPAGDAPEGKTQSLAIVDRAIDFQGREALEASTVSLRIGSKSGSFRIDAQVGDLFDYWVYTEEDGDDVVYHHTNTTGEVIEKLVNGKPVTLENEREAQRARDFVSQRVYFPFLPYRLRDPSVYLEDLGMETWDGAELHKVRVSFQPGTSSGADDQYLYWFDPDTAEMKQFAYSFSGGLRLRKMKNARRIDGIWFADADNYAKAGRDLSVNEITPQSVSGWELLSTIVVDEISVAPRA